MAHLLGFKYRSYRGMSIAAANKAAASSGDVGKEKKKVDTTAAATLRNIYPRSLHLSTAFLCAHGVLDPHALLPHLVPIDSQAATGCGNLACASGSLRINGN